MTTSDISVSGLLFEAAERLINDPLQTGGVVEAMFDAACSEGPIDENVSRVSAEAFQELASHIRHGDRVLLSEGLLVVLQWDHDPATTLDMKILFCQTAAKSAMLAAGV